MKKIILLIFVFVNVYIAQSVDPLVIKEALILKLDRNHRAGMITPNAIVASVETGKFETPTEGMVFKLHNKVLGTWRIISTDESNWFRSDSLTNSYVYVSYKSPAEANVILEANGNEMVYVNGIPRSGNPYGYQDTYESWSPRFDYSLIPIRLKKGNNHFLFRCDRKLLKVKLHFDKQGLLLNVNDLTIPDLIVNKVVDTYGALPIINATNSVYKNLFIKTYTTNSIPEYYQINEIHPLSITKVPFRIILPAFTNAGTVQHKIELVEKNGTNEKTLASAEIDLNVLYPNENHRVTFISEIDGSVQYYAVNPPVNLTGKPALFLSLHGAGVEAIGQARAYGHKNWGVIVAPTNRRPYGYNWENWGRLDAMEVLEIAKKKFDIDPNRVYLTGHSMGGHGTWHLGVNYPDQFAAIGPSAGWISIWSYRIRPFPDSNDVRNLLIRSARQSDTYAFSTNLKQNGIYIIHGEMDDNVLPEQSESMVANLSKFHKDYVYHLQEGAGHWWDNSDEPGADCVDWMPMFDFFARRAVAGKERIKTIDFTTANLAVSSKNNWIEIINQIKQQEISKINIHLEYNNRKFVGITNNIEMLSIEASILPAGNPIAVELDNQLISEINVSADGKIFLYKENGKWSLASEPYEKNKIPLRCGNFREVLNKMPVFVYGTNGNKKENEWAFQKVIYDTEKIWYRGNSSIEIIRDDEFDLEKYKDRSVILVGNSKTNSAWNKLLSNSPVQVDSKKIKVGNKEFVGKDYACLFIHPRSDSKTAYVAAISGTGAEGMVLANFTLYHDQYTGFPDIVIYNSDILHSDERGVKFTGYFGNDWSIEKGEFIIR
jgi:pimeloyl-ACP methyl ester carboxylesterase